MRISALTPTAYSTETTQNDEKWKFYTLAQSLSIMMQPTHSLPSLPHTHALKLCVSTQMA